VKNVYDTDLRVASQRQRKGRASDFAGAVEQQDQSMSAPIRSSQPSTSVVEGILLHNPLCVSFAFNFTPEISLRCAVMSDIFGGRLSRLP